MLRFAFISQSETLDLRIVFPINGSFSATILSLHSRSDIGYERGGLDYELVVYPIGLAKPTKAANGESGQGFKVILISRLISS